MSINNSYFSKNNTLISNSFVNTGRNPVTELFFGRGASLSYPNGYSRFIFDLNLDLLKQKYRSGLITTGCTDNVTHTLRMINTSFFNDELNTRTSQGRMRATSFDLILFRIPLSNGSTGNPQLWDEGVGYDFYDIQRTISTPNGLLTPVLLPQDKSYSQRPSNWFQTTTLGGWSKIGRAHV